jgi:exonuclease SbcD
MKLFHLSDLHLGKRLNEFSLIDDQRYILQKILDMMDEESPDAVLICGDVYDKPTPPVEAVSLFDEFLWDLTRRSVPVLIVSGNHDSAERLAFGSRIMERSRVFISRSYRVGAPPVVLEDDAGPVNFYLLPSSSRSTCGRSWRRTTPRRRSP